MQCECLTVRIFPIPCPPNLTRFKLWGVVPASEHQEILVALASLIRAQRYDMALTILDNELGGTLFCMTALSR